MKKNLTEEDIIDEAIDYISTDASLRKIAQLYNLSHVTIRYNFVNKLEQINRPLYKLVIDKMNKNKPKTVDDDNVRMRVSKACALILEQDLTIREIANILGETEFTIYRDLTTRLPKIKQLGEDTFTKVKEKLRQHSLDSLNKGIDPNIEMERENGKFSGRKI